MKWRGVATDYDGTLAHDGIVDRKTIDALMRFRETGRTLLLVTGRELDSLHATFSEVHLFDRVVAENGALIFNPQGKTQRILAQAPPPAFIEALRARGVTPLSVGRGIVATHRPFETIVLDVIRTMGLELQVVFNKNAVMVLPSGTNKATGLASALEEIAIPAAEIAGIGDAENDHSFLHACGLAVAVANALPTLKSEADWVTPSARGEGVVQLLEAIVSDAVPSRIKVIG